MIQFSVYHQVYNNKIQTERSLLSLKKLYPTVHVRLLCDGGVDHSDVAKRFDCEYIYDPINIGVFDELNPQVVSGKHPYGWNKEEGLLFLKRIYELCKSINTKYILFSEDDIIYNKSLTIINEEFDITGRIPSWNRFPKQFIDFIIPKFPKFNINEWGCCAGNFLKRECMIYCYENSIDFFDEYYDLILSETCKRIGWPDTLLNLIFGMHGMKYIKNYDYSEDDDSYPIYHDKISSRVRNN